MGSHTVPAEGEFRADREEPSLAIAHAQIQSPHSVHGDLQNILMKSISEQQLDSSHCPKT